eukprot:GHVS01047199.1.p1 GENE.GHVS01047199.1~~GHVS01047199.1.p1  ORF type:complete len:137 (+),score=14.48 GHVS01047199.1:182-592(+)
MLLLLLALTYAVSALSTFLAAPGEVHMIAAKRILRHLKGTVERGITYKSNNGQLQLIGYEDADWGNDKNNRKSISGYCFELQPVGGVISWRSSKQQVVALSTVEAEYIAMTTACQEAVYLAAITCHPYYMETTPDV